MPTIVYYTLAAAALLTAIGVIWQKGIKPLWHFLYEFTKATKEMLPLLKELTAVFRDSPNAFKVLDEIQAQFRTDSGSSLRDVVNRIEEAARLQQTASEKAATINDSLQLGAKAAEILSGIDRDKLQTLALMLDRLGVRIDAGVATGIRNEQRAIGVAEDLAASQQRADSEEGDAGAAADAAAKSEGKLLS